MQYCTAHLAVGAVLHGTQLAVPLLQVWPVLHLWIVTDGAAGGTRHCSRTSHEAQLGYEAREVVRLADVGARTGRAAAAAAAGRPASATRWVD